MHIATITIFLGVLAAQAAAASILTKRVDCNNGRGFCSGGSCQPKNDPSGAGPFVGSFAECSDGSRSIVNDFFNVGANTNSDPIPGATCNNGRGICNAKGQCEDPKDSSGAGPFVGNFDECFT